MDSVVRNVDGHAVEGDLRLAALSPNLLHEGEMGRKCKANWYELPDDRWSWPAVLLRDDVVCDSLAPIPFPIPYGGTTRRAR